MSVANLNASGNPISQDSRSINQMLEAIDGLTVQLKKTVLHAAESGDSFDSVKRSIRETVFRLGNQATELFIQMQGKGDLGPQIAAGWHWRSLSRLAVSFSNVWHWQEFDGDDCVVQRE